MQGFVFAQWREGPRTERPTRGGREEGGFDNGHIKAALLPEKGDDEPRLEAELPKKFPGMEWAE